MALGGNNMQLTIGTLMFFGGIIGMVVLVLIAFVCTKIFAGQRKRMLASIDVEKDGKNR